MNGRWQHGSATFYAVRDGALRFSVSTALLGNDLLRVKGWL